MSNEKKVTTETTTIDHSDDSSTTERTEKTVTTEKVEPKPEHTTTEEVTITEHRES